MTGPTDRQFQILEFIGTSIRERGYAPTMREICESLIMSSTNAANDHLRALERKGLIFRHDGSARTMTLTDAGWTLLGVRPGCCPHCGAVKAEPKSEVA